MLINRWARRVQLVLSLRLTFTCTVMLHLLHHHLHPADYSGTSNNRDGENHLVWKQKHGVSVKPSVRTLQQLCDITRLSISQSVWATQCTQVLGENTGTVKAGVVYTCVMHLLQVKAMVFKIKVLLETFMWRSDLKKNLQLFVCQCVCVYVW